jgi:hypothetical protein
MIVGLLAVWVVLTPFAAWGGWLGHSASTTDFCTRLATENARKALMSNDDWRPPTTKRWPSMKPLRRALDIVHKPSSNFSF